MPPSFHGAPQDNRTDHLVCTEYGCDAWQQMLLAGFDECRICALEFPAAHALIGARS
jgi:hypothetical protein